MPALRQALHYILAVGSLRHPRYLLPLHRYRDEVHLAIAAILEGYSLRANAASFGEQFYGLRRVDHPASKQQGAASARRSAAAFALLLIPAYARAKLEPLLGFEAEAEAASAAEAEGSAPTPPSPRLRLARIVYRTICALSDSQVGRPPSTKPQPRPCPAPYPTGRVECARFVRIMRSSMSRALAA